MDNGINMDRNENIKSIDNTTSSRSRDIQKKGSQGLEQMDFKLVLAFSNAYQNLYEKGKITEDQLEKVLELIDSYQQYTIDKFKQKLEGIFS